MKHVSLAYSPHVLLTRPPPHLALQKLFDHFDAAIAHAVAADTWQSAELWVRVQKPAAAGPGTGALVSW